MCLFPGYIEVKGGKVLQHWSDDPNNEKSDLGILKNRKEYRRVDVLGPAPKVKGKHFKSPEIFGRAVVSSLKE